MKIILKSYPAKSGHTRGIPGHQGGSAPADKPPTMPNQLERGSAGEINDRQGERVKIMEAAYPGIKFSRCTYNKLSVSEIIKTGIPGLTIPQAIMDFKAPIVLDAEAINMVKESAQRWKSSSGYLRVNTIKYDTGLTFQVIMGVLNHMRSEDPYSVSFSVDRLGKATAFKINT